MDDILELEFCFGWMDGLLLDIRLRLAGADAGPTPISSESERLKSIRVEGLAPSLRGKTSGARIGQGCREELEGTGPREELEGTTPGSCVGQ